MQTILPSNAASKKGQGSDSNYFLLLAQKETITKFTTGQFSIQPQRAQDV